MTGKAEPRVFRWDAVFPHDHPKPVKVDSEGQSIAEKNEVTASDLLARYERLGGLDALGRRR